MHGVYGKGNARLLQLTQPRAMIELDNFGVQTLVSGRPELRRRYLIELGVREEAANDFDDIVDHVALEQTVGVLGLEAIRRRGADVLDEGVEDGPDVGLGEDLFGFVLGVDVAVVEEVGVGLFDAQQAVFVCHDLFDVLE